MKVTALQKDGYLPFSLLDGLKCCWDNGFQSQTTDSLALSRAGGRRGRDMQERNRGHGERPCWAKMEEIIDQALHLQDLCLETSQALAKSDLVCETQKLLTDFFSPGYQLTNNECFYAVPFSLLPLLLLKLFDLERFFSSHLGVCRQIL